MSQIKIKLKMQPNEDYANRKAQHKLVIFYLLLIKNKTKTIPKRGFIYLFIYCNLHEYSKIFTITD